jgi:hypothetical protein
MVAKFGMVWVENKSDIHKKSTRKYFFATFLLIFIFSNTKSMGNDFFEIKNEIDNLRPKHMWQKIEITNSNAPVLFKFANKYLQEFCAKTDSSFPPVCLYYNSKDQENYNYYWDGKSILLGNAIIEILFYTQNFEKYFAALLAHEFAHFKLKHKPLAKFSQEEDADKLAFTLIDNPEDLVLAHLFVSLTFILAQEFAEYILNVNKLNTLVAQTMKIFATTSPEFGTFTRCPCWISVYHLFYEAFEKTKFNADLDIFINDLALNLVNVSSESHSKLNMVYLKIWGPRLVEFLKHPLRSDTHPSPKQLSKWCKNISANHSA